MKEESIFILVGIICILGFVYLLHYVSNHEGFEDIRMDLGDGDRGADAWYEKGTRRAGEKKGTVISKAKTVTPVEEKKAVVEPSQAPVTAAAAPVIREVPRAPQTAQAAPTPQAAKAAPTVQAAQAAPTPQAAQAAKAAPTPAVNRQGAPARTAGMPTTTGTPVEKTKFNFAPADIPPDVDVASAAGQADTGPELTAANTVKPAIPQINSRINEDMCRVVMNCGLTKL
jgi:hypothetical protein